MAAGDPLHQPNNHEGGLEASSNAYNPPLLPYEKDLIKILGCTEEEYKQLVRFNDQRPRIRPAEYAHIPDIVNDPVSIIVSIVVGVALTAASSLLAPKPEIAEAESKKKIRNEKLADQVGPSRFNQTTSFDGFSALVEYGIPVPISFGKRGTGADGVSTGGLVLAGSLVWSRAFSAGTFQRAKLLYSLGEWLPNAPSPRGIWIGTTVLDALGDRDFALYWKSQIGENRIKAANLIAGTRGTPGDGDPQTFDDIFTAPIATQENGQGFCMLYNPVTKSQFGQFSPVRNGTAHRVNWQVVSIPKQLQESEDPEDAIRAKRAERAKVSGPRASRTGFGEDKSLGGQGGVGRAYGTMMGIIAYNGVQTQNKIPRQNVAVGDTITFHIAGGSFEDLDGINYASGDLEGDPNRYGITHSDVTNAVNSLRVKADQAMVPGSRWIIAGTTWIVESRTPGIWKVGKAVNVNLRCVTTKGVPQIGIAGVRASTELLGGYEGPWFEGPDGPRPPQINADGFNTTKHCGAAFYNLCQFEVATARMVREADTIEFGIASTVWNRSNGLCNFPAIPTPKMFNRKDRNDINLNTPTQSQFFERTSCFEVYIRPITPESVGGGTKPAWSRIPQVFCITGNNPRKMYNYLRFRPRVKGRYEFRFSPRPGSDIAINGEETRSYWRLNAQSGEKIGQDFDTAYGAVRITMTGDLVAQTAVLLNKELVSGAAEGSIEPVETTVPTGLANEGFFGTPSSQTWTINAYLTQVLGRDPVRAGDTAVGYFDQFKPRGSGTADDGYIRVQVRATAGTGGGQKHYDTFGTYVSWAAGSWSFSVVNDGYTRGQWARNDRFTHAISVTGNNRYRVVGYTEMSARFRVTNVQTIVSKPGESLDDNARIFEENSQVSDCSHYVELEKSCDSGPEHEIVYCNEAVDDSRDGTPTRYSELAMLGLSIKSGPSVSAIEQLRVWQSTGINVERLVAGVQGPSNLLSDLIWHLFTDKIQGAGSYISPSLLDRNSFVETGEFLQQNKIQWNGVVESEQNLRQFAIDNASLSMCFFTVKNGVYGMQPALPYDASYAIAPKSIPIAQIFTAGNIIEDSFKISYLDIDSRRPAAIAIRWRESRDYELPDEDSLIIKYTDETRTLTETVDLTAFCDNREQALRTARFLLANRRYVDHTIEFQTIPDALSIEPGSYIKVLTEEVEFQDGKSIRIDDSGKVIAAELIEDGTYPATIYLPGADGVEEVEIEIVNGQATDEQLRGGIASLFSLASSENIYRVQELSLGEDMIVDVKAVVVPTSGSGNNIRSIVADQVLSSTSFEIIE